MLTRKQGEALAEQYRTNGLVRIAGFLSDAEAAELHAMLRGRDDWRRLFNSDDKVFEMDRSTQASLDADRRASLDEAVYAGARSEFQYRYETIRVPDDEEERLGSADPLAKLALQLSGGETRDLFHRVTGATRIRFADAQATAFSPGDFLTGHDDDFAGKERLAAYVLSLTPTWRIEWGGLLIMHGEGDQPSQAFPPAMNVMTLFRVPQMHSVSEVSRAAAYRRYSITGWLRG